MKISKLEREKCLNPFFFDGKTVSDIIFYNDSGIIVSVGRGWFGSNNNLDGLDVPEIVSKRKIDITKKLNFVVPHSAEGYYPSYKHWCCLYLYVDGTNITLDKYITPNKTLGKHDTDVHDVETYKGSILGVGFTFDKWVNFRRTEFGLKVDEMGKLFKEKGISIDLYNLEKLLENFDIVEK